MLSYCDILHSLILIHKKTQPRGTMSVKNMIRTLCVWRVPALYNIVWRGWGEKKNRDIASMMKSGIKNYVHNLSFYCY